MPALTRRQLLRAASATLGSGALLGERLGRADAATAPQRLVLFPMINGAPTKGTYENIGPNMFWPEDMSTLSRITEPLAPFKERLTFIRGLWIEGSNNHQAIRSLYSGAVVENYDVPDDVRVPSLDQVVARHFQASALPAPLPTLHLAASPADFIHLYKGGRSNLFFTEEGAVDYEANPVKAYDSLFGEGATPAIPPDDDEDEYRRLAVELVAAEVGELEAELVNSPAQAAKLSSYGSALDKLRAAGPAPAAAECGVPVIDAVERLRPHLGRDAQGVYADAAAYDGAYYADIVEAQFAILAHALVCGLTRVGTFQASSADNGRGAIIPVAAPDGAFYAHHTCSHMDLEFYGECQRWYAERLASFLALLNVPDPLGSGETVLDNTTVLWLAECHPADHGSSRLPAVTIGSAGGKLKTNTIIDLDPIDYHDFSSGPTNRQLLRTVCNALGVGDSASHFGAGTIAELEA
jgi:hypothetical protein